LKRPVVPTPKAKSSLQQVQETQRADPDLPEHMVLPPQWPSPPRTVQCRVESNLQGSVLPVNRSLHRAGYELFQQCDVQPNLPGLTITAQDRVLAGIQSFLDLGQDALNPVGREAKCPSD
jgi:hypothetical protein